MADSCDVHKFATGAVRSRDADSTRYDLITPIGLQAVADVYADGLSTFVYADDDEEMAGFQVDTWLGHALRLAYGFLSGDHDSYLVPAAACVLEAIQATEDDILNLEQSGPDGGCSWEAIPPAGLKAVAEAYTEGSTKYGDYNWERGMDVLSLLNHGIRHIVLYLAGDDSEPHLGHAAWNLLAAIHSLELWPDLNAGKLRGPDCTRPEPAGTQPRLSWAAAADAYVTIGDETFPVANAAILGGGSEGRTPVHAGQTGVPAIDDFLLGKGDPPVLYVSGPMTGIEKFNFPLFNRTAQNLRDLGFPVLNPADFGVCKGLSWADNLARDLGLLGHADAIVLLPGWEQSKGACLEYQTGLSLGMGTVDAGKILT